MMSSKNLDLTHPGESAGPRAIHKYAHVLARLLLNKAVVPGFTYLPVRIILKKPLFINALRNNPNDL